MPNIAERSIFRTTVFGHLRRITLAIEVSGFGWEAAWSLELILPLVEQVESGPG